MMGKFYRFFNWASARIDGNSLACAVKNLHFIAAENAMGDRKPNIHAARISNALTEHAPTLLSESITFSLTAVSSWPV